MKTDRQLRAFPVGTLSGAIYTVHGNTRLNLATRLMARQLKNEMNRLETIVYTSVLAARYACGLQAESTAVYSRNVGRALVDCYVMSDVMSMRHRLASARYSVLLSLSLRTSL